MVLRRLQALRLGSVRDHPGHPSYTVCWLPTPRAARSSLCLHDADQSLFRVGRDFVGLAWTKRALKSVDRTEPLCVERAFPGQLSHLLHLARGAAWRDDWPFSAIAAFAFCKFCTFSTASSFDRNHKTIVSTRHSSFPQGVGGGTARALCKEMRGGPARPAGLP
jgi:hypothetical protein